ncbi:MAG: DUF362 domain-containing protein [Chloroflexota bacterium]
MIYEATQFVFEPTPAVSRARRVLIKPAAGYPMPHPVTTSLDTLRAVVEGIKKISDADIVILEGTPTGDPVYPIYRKLKFEFPHVLMLDVKDCIWVEIENPLLHPLAMPTFWVPNVVLSSDYLISIAPFQVRNKSGFFTIPNLISLLPIAKYGGHGPSAWKELQQLGMQKVLADLYFTLPFDLGIIDGRKKLTGKDDPTKGEIADYGKIFIGEPYEVDREASHDAGVETEYLALIDSGRSELETT